MCLFVCSLAVPVSSLEVLDLLWGVLAAKTLVPVGVAAKSLDGGVVINSKLQQFLTETLVHLVEGVGVLGLQLCRHGFNLGTHLLGVLGVFGMLERHQQEHLLQVGVLIELLTVVQEAQDVLEGLGVSGEGFGVLAEHLAGELVEKNASGEAAIFVSIPALALASHVVFEVLLKLLLDFGIVLGLGAVPNLHGSGDELAISVLVSRVPVLENSIDASALSSRDGLSNASTCGGGT